MSDLGAAQNTEELKKLSVPELELLAEELRQKITSVCLKNGGHIGASLGAVDLSVALHRIFDSPKDKIIWDVGHQAYAHKLLTGRDSEFESMRTFGGISGFLSREESPHDIFGAGHSSTSLSAALGVSSTSSDWTVAVIGDGAITAGLALEALNNIKSAARAGPLLIILNDNQMSISENVGAIHEILNGGAAGDFFSAFGLDYVGPVSGHHMGQLLAVLNGIKTSRTDKPVILHVLTQKGKGYGPAETRPEKYHGVSPMKLPVDKTEPENKKQAKTWSEVFCDAVIKLADEDERIHLITAAMTDGTGLKPFERKYPHRISDVGIAEPHAVTFSAGMATNGKRPIVAIYSTFLQRAIDGMIHDVALQKLPVIFAIDRAGVVGADGPTHHGVFDLIYTRMIPGFTVYTPESAEDLEECLRDALAKGGPCAIRYPRGEAQPRALEATQLPYFITGNANNPKKAVISFGEVGRRVKSSSEIMHVHVIRPKPFPEKLLKDLNKQTLSEIIFIEDGAKAGGFGEGYSTQILEEPALRSLVRKVSNFGYPDQFIPHGSPRDLEKWLSDAQPGRSDYIS